LTDEKIAVVSGVVGFKPFLCATFLALLLIRSLHNVIEVRKLQFLVPTMSQFDHTNIIPGSKKAYYLVSKH